MITVTAPLVAAPLLVTPINLPEHDRHLAHGKSFRHGCHTCVPDGPRPMVLRFLPTDADTECETCGGGRFGAGGQGPDRCPDCGGTRRRPLRAGDRIAIRADDNVPECDCDQWDEATQSVVPFRAPHACSQVDTTDLRPGEVVGHATVARVLPIRPQHPTSPQVGDYVFAPGWSGVAQAWINGDVVHLSDHLDAGLVFTPGQVALELTDAEAS